MSIVLVEQVKISAYLCVAADRYGNLKFGDGIS